MKNKEKRITGQIITDSSNSQEDIPNKKQMINSKPTQNSNLIPNSNSMVYEYGLGLIRKIKHQMYDFLERMVLGNEQNHYEEQKEQHKWYKQDNDVSSEQGSNPEMLEYKFKHISFIDPLSILETHLFQKYQHQLIQLINQRKLSYYSQQQTMKQVLIHVEVQDQFVELEDQFTQVSQTQILQQLKQLYSQGINDQLEEITYFIEEIAPDAQNTTNQSPAKQCACQCKDEYSSLNNQSQSGQRQLQLLIREKQMNKKLIELTQQLNSLSQQLNQAKNKLESKQSLILTLKKQLNSKNNSINSLNRQITSLNKQLNSLNKQLNSLNKLIQDQNINKLKQNKVKSFKDKIQIESIKREYSLERQRDNLQLMIQKENIHSNHQSTYCQLSARSFCDSTIKQDEDSSKSLYDLPMKKTSHSINSINRINKIKLLQNYSTTYPKINSDNLEANQQNQFLG